MRATGAAVDRGAGSRQAGPPEIEVDLREPWGDGEAGLYVHVPFCERICPYCDFNRYLLRDGGVEEYLAGLEAEAAFYGRRLARQAPGLRFATLYVGGGTPTALTPGQLRALFASLRRHLPLDDVEEVTVEANPGTLSPAKLAALREAGVTRLSLGVQSLDDGLLERLGRIHRAEHARRSFRRARAFGFPQINVDLMFGLPGQTVDAWRRTLEEVVAWGPEHISCYSLIVEENTPFGQLHARGELPLPGEDAEAAMYEEAIACLQEGGWEHYEISNFARPGCQSRHNRIYWRNGDWLGLGPGAHSQWGPRRWANRRLPADWGAALAAGRAPVEWVTLLDEAEAMEDTLILGLRLLVEGVEVERFRRRFGLSPADVFGPVLERLVGWGLLEVSPLRIRLSRRGRFLATRAMVELVGAGSTAASTAASAAASAAAPGPPGLHGSGQRAASIPTASSTAANPSRASSRASPSTSRPTNPGPS